jgi:hypothetical protein
MYCWFRKDVTLFANAGGGAVAGDATLLSVWACAEDTGRPSNPANPIVKTSGSGGWRRDEVRLFVRILLSGWTAVAESLLGEFIGLGFQNFKK